MTEMRCIALLQYWGKSKLNNMGEAEWQNIILPETFKKNLVYSISIRGIKFQRLSLYRVSILEPNPLHQPLNALGESEVEMRFIFQLRAAFISRGYCTQNTKDFRSKLLLISNSSDSSTK